LQLLPHHSLSAGSVCCQGAFCSQGHFTVSCSLQKNIPYIKLGLVTQKLSLINPKKSTNCYTKALLINPKNQLLVTQKLY
jgi:hypothetical protein